MSDLKLTPCIQTSRYIDIFSGYGSNPRNLASRLRFSTVWQDFCARRGRAEQRRLLRQQNTRVAGPSEKKSGPVRARCIVAARSDAFIYN